MRKKKNPIKLDKEAAAAASKEPAEIENDVNAAAENTSTPDTNSENSNSEEKQPKSTGAFAFTFNFRITDTDGISTEVKNTQQADKESDAFKAAMTALGRKYKGSFIEYLQSFTKEKLA